MDRSNGHVCPVCGKHIFARIGDFEICPICNWENDKLQELDPEFSGGANPMSLNDARRAYYEESDFESTTHHLKEMGL